MAKRGYAKRKYLKVCDPDVKVLTLKEVGKVINEILERLPEGRIVTLNRIISEVGYDYYTVHGISRLVKELKRRGVHVERYSRRRYIAIKKRES